MFELTKNMSDFLSMKIEQCITDERLSNYTSRFNTVTMPKLLIKQGFTAYKKGEHIVFYKEISENNIKYNVFYTSIFGLKNPIGKDSFEYIYDFSKNDNRISSEQFMEYLTCESEFEDVVKNVLQKVFDLRKQI